MPYTFIRLPEVKRLTGKSKAAIYREIKKGKFPRQISNGEKTVAWLKDDITKWQEECIKESLGETFRLPAESNIYAD